MPHVSRPKLRLFYCYLKNVICSPVRDEWFCLGALCLKSQILISNDQNLPKREIVWIFEFLSAGFLEDWSLEFDNCNFNNSISFQCLGSVSYLFTPTALKNV
jgi:hypothetical protein